MNGFLKWVEIDSRCTPGTANRPGWVQCHACLGMGPPDLWESMSDRLLSPPLLKTDFSLRLTEIGPGDCARAKDICSMVEGSKKGKFQDFHDFRASGGRERPPTGPTGSGMTLGVPPGPWESISDRLLSPQRLKTEFSLRNWSGRLSACKGYAPYYALLYKAQRRSHCTLVFWCCQ